MHDEHASVQPAATPSILEGIGGSCMPVETADPLAWGTPHHHVNVPCNILIIAYISP